MFTLSLSLLLDRLKNEVGFTTKFMDDYGPGKATRHAYDRDQDGNFVICFDNAPSAGPIKDDKTDVLRVAKIQGGEGSDTDVLVKRQEFTQQVGDMTKDEAAMLGNFYTDFYLTAGTDALFTAEADNELDGQTTIDHFFSEKVGEYQVDSASEMLDDFICLDGGKAQIYADGRTGVLGCVKLAQNLRDGRVFAGTSKVVNIGDAKLVRMPVCDGKQSLGFIRKSDGVLVVMNPTTLEPIDNVPLGRRLITAGRANNGQINDTIVIFSKTAMDVDEYTFEEKPAASFFGSSKLKDYADAIAAP